MVAGVQVLADTVIHTWMAVALITHVEFAVDTGKTDHAITAVHFDPVHTSCTIQTWSTQARIHVYLTGGANVARWAAASDAGVGNTVFSAGATVQAGRWIL